METTNGKLQVKNKYDGSNKNYGVEKVTIKVQDTWKYCVQCGNARYSVRGIKDECIVIEATSKGNCQHMLSAVSVS